MATQTVTVNPAGGEDYLSIQAAVDAWAGDQGGDDLVMTLIYTTTSDTSTPDISGITNFASLTMSASAGSRCNLDEDEGYFIDSRGGNVHGIDIDLDNVTLSGVRIRTEGAGKECVKARGDNIVIEGCYIGDAPAHGIEVNSSSTTIYAINNFINRPGDAGISVANRTGVTLYAYNNFINRPVQNGGATYCGLGFANLGAWDHTGSVIYAFNNVVALASGSSSGDYWEGENGTFHSTSANNYSSDTSASTYLPSGQGNTDSVTVTDNTAQTGTRHVVLDDDNPNLGSANGRYAALVDATSTTQDVGTDLSADAFYPFSTDALGNSRPSGSWDVGPHQLTSGSASITVNDTAQAFTIDTPTLSSLTTLSIDDQAYNFSVDNLSLADVGTIIAQEVAFAFSTDVVNLTSDDSLSLQALEFNFTVDQLTLTAEFPLTVNDVSWGFTVEAPTLVSSVLGTVTIPALTNNAGSVEASQSSILYWVYDSTFTTLIASGTDATTDGSGNLVINNAAITAATDYWVFYFENLLDTGKRGSRLITAT